MSLIGTLDILKSDDVGRVSFFPCIFDLSDSQNSKIPNSLSKLKPLLRTWKNMLGTKKYVSIGLPVSHFQVLTDKNKNDAIP